MTSKITEEMSRAPQGMVLPYQLDQSKFLTVTEDKNSGRIIVDVRGNFPNDEHEIAFEIRKIRELSATYGAIEYHIRSDGGCAYSCIELLNTTKWFGQVITFAYGNVASAGAILWAAGDVRVINDYAFIMFHRESYMSYGKGEDQRKRIDFTDIHLGEMINEVCRSVLTEDELDTIKHDDLYFTASQLVSREVAITSSQYITRNETLMGAAPSLIMIDGCMYVVNSTSLRKVSSLEFSGEPVSLYDVYTMKVSDDEEDEEEELLPEPEKETKKTVRQPTRKRAIKQTTKQKAGPSK